MDKREDDRIDVIHFLTMLVLLANLAIIDVGLVIVLTGITL